MPVHILGNTDLTKRFARHTHPEGTVLPFSSAACNVTASSEIACICAGGFVYFVVNKMSYCSVSGPSPLLSFACTYS